MTTLRELYPEQYQDEDSLRSTLGLGAPEGASEQALGLNIPSPTNLGPRSINPGYSQNVQSLFRDALRVKQEQEAKRLDRPTSVEMLKAFQRDQAKQQKAIEEQRARQEQALAQRALLLSEEGPIADLHQQAEDVRTRMLEPIAEYTGQGIDWLEQAREQARNLGPQAEDLRTQAVSSAQQAKDYALDNYTSRVAKMASLKVGNLWSDFNEQADLFRQRNAGSMTPEQIEQNVYNMKMATHQQAAQIGAQLDIEYEGSRAKMNQDYDNLISQVTNSADWRVVTAQSKGVAAESQLAATAANMYNVALQYVENAELQSSRLHELASSLYARGLADDAEFLIGLDSYTDPFDIDEFIFAYGLAEMDYTPQYRGVASGGVSRGGSDEVAMGGGDYRSPYKDWGGESRPGRAGQRAPVKRIQHGELPQVSPNLGSTPDTAFV